MNPIRHPASSFLSTSVAVAQRHLAFSVVPWAVIGACIAIVLYALEILTGLGVPIVYSFPPFYRLENVFDLDALYGFCIQCVLYGAIVGVCAHASRTKLGVFVVVVLHVLSIAVCPMLA